MDSTFATQIDSHPNCELCRSVGGALIWQDANWRVIRVEDTAFPAFYRVVCNHHVAEFGDLLGAERDRCMDLVIAVERVLRETLQPTKINLASLGNVVPHLHWHIVARFEWDSHFPMPIWATAQRTVEPPPAQRLASPLAMLDAAVAQALQALPQTTS